MSNRNGHTYALFFYTCLKFPLLRRQYRIKPRNLQRNNNKIKQIGECMGSLLGTISIIYQCWDRKGAKQKCAPTIFQDSMIISLCKVNNKFVFLLFLSKTIVSVKICIFLFYFQWWEIIENNEISAYIFILVATLYKLYYP